MKVPAWAGFAIIRCDMCSCSRPALNQRCASLDARVVAMVPSTPRILPFLTESLKFELMRRAPGQERMERRRVHQNDGKNTPDRVFVLDDRRVSELGRVPSPGRISNGRQDLIDHISSLSAVHHTSYIIVCVLRSFEMEVDSGLPHLSTTSTLPGRDARSRLDIPEVRAVLGANRAKLDLLRKEIGRIGSPDAQDPSSIDPAVASVHGQTSFKRPTPAARSTDRPDFRNPVYDEVRRRFGPAALLIYIVPACNTISGPL